MNTLLIFIGGLLLFAVSLAFCVLQFNERRKKAMQFITIKERQRNLNLLIVSATFFWCAISSAGLVWISGDSLWAPADKQTAYASARVQSTGVETTAANSEAAILQSLQTELTAARIQLLRVTKSADELESRIEVLLERLNTLIAHDEQTPTIYE